MRWMLILTLLFAACASGEAIAAVSNATGTTITNQTPISPKYGNTINFSVHVARSADNALPPGGSMSCTIAPSTTLPSVAVSNGAATCSVPGTLIPGSYTITASYIPDPSDATLAFAASTSSAWPFIVTKATVLITANNITKTFGSTLTGGAGFTAFTTAGLASGETIGSVTVAYGTGATAGDPTGTYVGQVQMSSASGGTFNPANYNFSYAYGNIIVTAAPTPSIGATGNLSARTTTYGTASSSGTFNVSGTNMTAGITVTPPTGFEVSTDNASFASTVIVGAAGTISSTPVYIRLAKSTNAGSYPGSVVLSSSGAASQSFVMPSGTVGKGTLTYTASPAMTTYGTVPSGLVGTVTGFVNGEIQATATTGTLTFSTPATATSSVGTYAINGGGLTANNYVFVQAASNVTALTINPTTLTVTANARNKTYGQTATFTGTEFTSSGLQNGETIGSATLASTGAVAMASVSGSPYAITITNANGGTFNPANYTIGYVSGTLTVTAAPLTVTANVASKTYGQSDPALTYASAGLVNGDTLSGNLARAAGENAGTYAINQGTLTAGGNYTISFTGANLTINKAALTITANNQSRAYGAADPVFTWTPSGFVSGDTAALLSGTPTMGSSDTPTSAVGTTYPITIAQGTLAAANYTFAFVNGTLSISSKASQTITFGAAPSMAVNGTGTVTATTTATPAASYPITFSTTSTDCTVTSAGVVTGKNAGTNNCVITATQAGDANYNAAAPVTQTLSISKKTTTITLTATPNPVAVGATVTITTTVLGDPPTGTVMFCSNATTINSSCTGGSLLCTVALVPGATTSTATCTTSFATAGAQSLGAFYSGDGNFTATATAQAQIVALSVVAPLVPAPALGRWAILLLGGFIGLAVVVRQRRVG